MLFCACVQLRWRCCTLDVRLRPCSCAVWLVSGCMTVIISNSIYQIRANRAYGLNFVSRWMLRWPAVLCQYRILSYATLCSIVGCGKYFWWLATISQSLSWTFYSRSCSGHIVKLSNVGLTASQTDQEGSLRVVAKWHTFTMHRAFI